MPRARATAATVQLRVAEIVGLLCSGATRVEIQAHGQAEWGLRERQIDNLIAMARDEIRSDWDIQRSDMTAQLLSGLSDLQQEARTKGRLNVALGCINVAARIAGIA